MNYWLVLDIDVQTRLAYLLSSMSMSIFGASPRLEEQTSSLFLVLTSSISIFNAEFQIILFFCRVNTSKSSENLC